MSPAEPSPRPSWIRCAVSRWCTTAGQAVSPPRVVLCRRTGWTGEPVNRELAKHAGLVWIDPAAPGDDLVAYTWAPHAIQFQEPDSPVCYEPGYESELTLAGLPPWR